MKIKITGFIRQPNDPTVSTYVDLVAEVPSHELMEMMCVAAAGGRKPTDTPVATNRANYHGRRLASAFVKWDKDSDEPQST